MWYNMTTDKTCIATDDLAYAWKPNEEESSFIIGDDINYETHGNNQIKYIGYMLVLKKKTQIKKNRVLSSQMI